MNRAQAHFLGHLSASFLSGSLLRFLSVSRLISDSHLSAAFFHRIKYDVELSVLVRSFFLISTSRLLHLFDSFSFDVNFLVSFLSLSSQTLDSTWLNTKTAYVKLTPPSVLHTAVFVSQESSAVRPCSIDSLEMYDQASLRTQLLIANDSVLFYIELTATIASRHTGVCTGAHISIRTRSLL